MKRILASLGIVASALAVSDFSTIRSTTISSSCTSSQVVPTAFVYSNATLNINLASYESSSEEFIYEYYTVTDNHDAFVTETICSDGNCYVTTVAQSLTTFTTTVDGVLVTVVTAAPATSEIAAPTTSEIAALTSHTTEDIQRVSSITTSTPTTSMEESLSSSVVSSDSTEVSSAKAMSTTSGIESSSEVIEVPSTTVVTITSCSNNICSKVPLTTGLTTITKDSTVYTTYCPLSGKSTSEVATSSSSVQIPASSVAESSLTSSVAVSSTKTIPTTIITTLECTGGACSRVTHTTGLTVVTDISTAYTTYCPLEEELSSSSTTSTSLSKSSPKSIPTIDVITGNIVTQTVSSVLSLSTSVATSSAYIVSTYEAGAQSNTLEFTTIIGFFLYCLALL